MKCKTCDRKINVYNSIFQGGVNLCQRCYASYLEGNLKIPKKKKIYFVNYANNERESDEKNN